MYHIKAIFIIGSIGLIGTVVSVAGLFTTTGAVSVGSIDIRGTVIRLNRIEDLRRKKIRGGAQIEGTQDADTRYNKASVGITDETEFFRIVDGERKTASFADLKPGQRVEAKFTGPVLESYPVQATAAEIVVLEH